MVAKLIKHQLRDDARVIPYLYALILALGALILAVRPLNSTLAIAASALYMILASGGYVAVFIFIAMRFYQSMFGSEGYLNQTLPVRQGSLFAVKAGIGFAEILLYLGCMVFSVFVLLMAVASAEPSIGELFTYLSMPVGRQAIGWFTGLLVIQTAEQLMMVLLAITLAHTKPFAKSPAAIALALFAGLYIVNNIAVLLFTLVLPISLRIGASGISVVFSSMAGDLFNIAASADASLVSDVNIGLSGILFELIATIVGYCVNVRLLKRSVNVR